MLTFLLPLLFVGSLMFLNWQLGRPVKHPPPGFYRPVESAKDVDPEELEWIRRRNEAQLATRTRGLCFEHDFDERGVCRRCKGIRMGGPNPHADRHVAFPFDAAVEHAQKAIASATSVPPSSRAEQCARTAHVYAWEDPLCCIRCGQMRD